MDFRTLLETVLHMLGRDTPMKMTQQEILDTASPRFFEAANQLFRTGRQDRKTWEANPVPKPPNAPIPLKTLRQGLVLGFPCLLITVCYQAFGLEGAVFAVAPAGFIYLVMRERLRQATNNHSNRVFNIDGGRYAFTAAVCWKFGLKPQEVTYDLAFSMRQKYIDTWTARMCDLAGYPNTERNRHLMFVLHTSSTYGRSYDETYARYKDLAPEEWHDEGVFKAAYAMHKTLVKAFMDGQAKARQNTSKNVTQSRVDGVVSKAVAAAAALGASSVAMPYIGWDSSPSGTNTVTSNLTVNPANGLPMVGNSCLDVQGNVFGTDTHDWDTWSSQETASTGGYSGLGFNSFGTGGFDTFGSSAGFGMNDF